MKDGASTDMPRGAASRRRSGDVRMGKPGRGNVRPSAAEFIGGEKGTVGTETSQYREEEKSTEIPSVAASERGGAQTADV